MFGTIRKHQTWLWVVISTLTIISFVYYFGPQSKVGSERGGPANLGTINGERITPEEYEATRREVHLRYFFMSGAFPNEESRNRGFDEVRETYYRLLFIHKQKDLGIHIGDETVARTAWNMLRPLQKANINSPTVFIKQILEPHGFQVEDFDRFIRHELGIQELISTVGLSGKLVTPQEAKGFYVREHEELATEAVFLSASNYLGGVTATPEAVSQYYSNHIANYRIPVRLQVSYVEYVLTNFLTEANEEMAKMTNIDQRLEAVYQQRGTNYYREAKSPQEAKEKIREEMRKELMAVAANKKASVLANELFDKEPMRPENLAALGKEKGLTVKVTAPFDLEEGPKDIKVSADFAKRAFALSPTNEPFVGPLLGEDALYVIAFDKRIPSEIPPLDQIRERVTADYKYDQARILALQAGQALYTALTNGMAQAKSFSNICAEAKSQATELPPFSLSTRALPQVEEHISLNGPGGLKELAFGTPAGKISNFQPTSEGGLILYVKAKLPLDPTKMNTDLPSYVESMRQTRQSEAFNEWFRKQAERGLRDTPLGWPKTAPSLNSRTAKS
jgi:hypothetical protein